MNKKISAVVTLSRFNTYNVCYGSFDPQQKRRQSGTKIIQHSSVKSERKNRRKQFKKLRIRKKDFEQGFESI